MGRLPDGRELRILRRGPIETVLVRRVRTVGHRPRCRRETAEGPLYELHSVGIE